MRPVRLLAVLLCVFGSAALIPAQAPQAAPKGTSDGQAETPVLRRVTLPGGVAVRSGPSERYAPTAHLPYGERVLVLRESAKAPGWLEIKPPPGSHSWINSRFVQRWDDVKFVAAVACADDGPVPTRPGSTAKENAGQVLNVENAKRLSRGTLLVVLGEKTVAADDESWLPIAPTPEEVRYIPAQAVAGSKAEPFAPLYAGGDTVARLIAQADEAYHNQQWLRAHELYLQAARSTSNYEQLVHCNAQLGRLSQRTGMQQASLVLPGHPLHPASRKEPSSLQLTKQTVTTYANQSASRQAGAAPQPAKWSSWGYLRPARFQHEGRPMFVLVDPRGNPIVYAATTPDLTLEPYVGQLLTLYGPTYYRSDSYFRNHYMLVSHVHLAKQAR